MSNVLGWAPTPIKYDPLYNNPALRSLYYSSYVPCIPALVLRAQVPNNYVLPKTVPIIIITQIPRPKYWVLGSLGLGHKYDLQRGRHPFPISCNCKALDATPNIIPSVPAVSIFLRPRKLGIADPNSAPDC